MQIEVAAEGFGAVLEADQAGAKAEVGADLAVVSAMAKFDRSADGSVRLSERNSEAVWRVFGALTACPPEAAPAVAWHRRQTAGPGRSATLLAIMGVQ